MPPLPSLSIATLATAPLACAAASGVGLGGSSLMGAGLFGLAALTILSERWRRHAAGIATAPENADLAPAATSVTASP
jgi:hypothetical protein